MTRPPTSRPSAQRSEIMPVENSKLDFGWRVYGLGGIAIALVCLAFGDFDSGQPVPASFPGRAVLAYVAAAFLLAAGLGIEWRRTTARAAAALILYYGLVVVVLMNGRVILAD